MIIDQLATETDLSVTGLHAALIQLLVSNAVELVVHSEEFFLGTELANQRFRVVIDPTMSKGAWYVTDGTNVVWGSRGTR